MTRHLFLRFAIDLETFELDEFIRPKGPLFHRWLPDGREDAISVSVDDDRNRLEFWFERRGFVEGSFITYDHQRREVDPDRMKRQGKLDAGGLRGLARFGTLSGSEYDAITSGDVGSDDYFQTGKRVLEFITPPIARFVDTLITQYGQYWLREIPQWDSRQQSLGAYCVHFLSLTWNDEESGDDWNTFCPDDMEHKFIVLTPDRNGYAEYLTETDWRVLQTSFNATQGPALAMYALGKAKELFGTGHISEAFVQAVTALETALYESLRKDGPTDKSPKDKSAMDEFSNLSLKTRITVVVAARRLPLPSDSCLPLALRGIELRNKIVHEGERAKPNDSDRLHALLDLTATLLDLPTHKAPELNTGNELSRS